MTTCAKCGSHLRQVDGICPACAARSITSLLTANRQTRADDDAEVPGYDLEDIIGRGGMGVVYRAVRLDDDQVVAVKLLPLHLADRDDVADRFAREAHALAAFNHPHVLRVLDSGITPEGRLFLVTELAEGGDLAKRLQQGPLAVDEAVQLYRQVVGAIGEAHRQGIAHRDIKPANILLDARGTVRVGDFSLAKLLREGAAPQFTMTQSSDVFGTPYYIAPEVRRGANNADERADIFSLGVLLHEMLTGRLPIGNYEPASKLVAVPRAVDNVIANCLQEDPAKRPATIGVLEQQLTAALKGGSRVKAIAIAAALAAGAIVLFTMQFYHPLAHDATADVLPTSATKASPWINSLGMKFVPVPGTRVLFSVWETRRCDFTAFASETKGNAREDLWLHLDHDVTPDHAVTPVNWLQSSQFCDWLSKKEHESHRLPVAMHYRLPHDDEWSTAAELAEETGNTPEERSGKLGPMLHAPYPWGRFWPPPGDAFPANFAGQEADAVVPNFVKPVLHHRDAFPWTAPVGSFLPNSLGLYDMSGNVSEWCAESWNDLIPDKTLRGGAYNQCSSNAMRLDARDHANPTKQQYGVGFRVVIDPGQ